MQGELFEFEDPKASWDTTDGMECPTCKETKPLSEYYVRPDGRNNGSHRNCKDCYKENNNVVYVLRKENPYPYENPVCECCGIESHSEVLCLDHCHIEKVFRGWLCRSCNTGIGSLGDDIEGLEKGLTYLKGHYDER
tara:strand:+ start:1361 stop:1771 length:411 start_codon:yes stop_codon:yes gene_type:complete